MQIIQFFSFFYEITLRLVGLEQQPQTGNVEVLLPDTFRGDRLRYELFDISYEFVKQPVRLGRVLPEKRRYSAEHRAYLRDRLEAGRQDISRVNLLQAALGRDRNYPAAAG